MTSFTPFNWYTAGFNSPIHYYLFAVNYEHNFKNIVILKTTQNNNKYSIYGKCIINDKLCDFVTHITEHFEGAFLNHEGDFTIKYQGLTYRINTTIDTESISNKNEYDLNNNAIDNINLINLNLPNYVIKIVLLVLYLEI